MIFVLSLHILIIRLSISLSIKPFFSLSDMLMLLFTFARSHNSTRLHNWADIGQLINAWSGGSGIFTQYGHCSESEIFILKRNCLVFNLLCKISNFDRYTQLGNFCEILDTDIFIKNIYRIIQMNSEQVINEVRDKWENICIVLVSKYTSVRHIFNKHYSTYHDL